jgi:hypothetical protein
MGKGGRRGSAVLEKLGFFLFEEEADAIEVDGGVAIFLKVGAEFEPVRVVPFAIVTGDEILCEAGFRESRQIFFGNG